METMSLEMMLGIFYFSLIGLYIILLGFSKKEIVKKGENYRRVDK